MLYGGKESDTIAKLRYMKYLGMASSPKLSPERLPPSERAAYHRALDVLENVVNTEDWGWRVLDGKFLYMFISETYLRACNH